MKSTLSKERRSLELTPQEWAALEQMAVETGSTSERGPTARRPSWRVLVERIAAGELKVSEPPL